MTDDFSSGERTREVSNGSVSESRILELQNKSLIIQCGLEGENPPRQFAVQIQELLLDQHASIGFISIYFLTHSMPMASTWLVCKRECWAIPEHGDRIFGASGRNGLIAPRDRGRFLLGCELRRRRAKSYVFDSVRRGRMPSLRLLS